MQVESPTVQDTFQLYNCADSIRVCYFNTSPLLFPYTCICAHTYPGPSASLDPLSCSHSSYCEFAAHGFREDSQDCQIQGTEGNGKESEGVFSLHVLALQLEGLDLMDLHNSYM